MTPMAQTLPSDESGYEAWLRYPVKQDGLAKNLAPGLRVFAAKATVTALPVQSALQEWTRAFQGFLGESVKMVNHADEAGVIFSLDDSLGAESYQLRRAPEGGVWTVAGGDAAGILYGTFAALSALARTGEWPTGEVTSAPLIPLRMLNHWDNMVIDPVHGSIERVRGNTIFEWQDLTVPNPRYHDYARLLASLGINATCINNVNAEPEILAPATIQGLAALAAILRSWGVRLFVSVNFGSPVFLGGLKTADPLDPAVQAWWKAKADEIYAAIPDFGGFLVKADSEGKPGPGTYGRGHLDGARLLGEALAPHGGTVLWRTFVYGRDVSARAAHAKAATDRANHASLEFEHLAGQFPENVILQIKNSATDFQTWEPVHTLFGHLPNTRLAMEFALTKEYQGNDIDLGWEGFYFHHSLNFKILDQAQKATAADVISGRSGWHPPGAITAVANLHNARNWFGHLLAGGTLFTFGRLAWNPFAEPEAILREYADLVFGREAAPEVVAVMRDSYDVVASYTMPMGLTYITEFLHHFEPDPWENHQSAGITESGIGTDRTTATGSGYIGRYPSEVASLFENPTTCPEKFLLYFHHLPWTHHMADGRSLLQTLYDGYASGVEEIKKIRSRWRGLHGQIDLERWAHVYEKLALQQDRAERWRDLVGRFLYEKSGLADEHRRFHPDVSSPHNRLQSGFWRAVEDYHARVQREKIALEALTAPSPADPLQI